MILAIITLALVICGFLPQLWVRYVMRKHHQEIPDLPGTGGELAKHLIERFELTGVTVVQGGEGQDFYNPSTKTVSLSPKNYLGRSVTAVSVSSHEVGHAIQFFHQEPLSRLRDKYLPIAALLGKMGVYMLLSVPVVTVIFKAPAAIVVFVILSLVLQLAGAAMYLIVLPEELDASFKKALPILKEGEYLPERMLPAAQEVLKAAALTYCAAALANVLNIGRWFMILLRR